MIKMDSTSLNSYSNTFVDEPLLPYKYCTVSTDVQYYRHGVASLIVPDKEKEYSTYCRRRAQYAW